MDYFDPYTQYPYYKPINKKVKVCKKCGKEYTITEAEKHISEYTFQIVYSIDGGKWSTALNHC